MEAEGAGGGGEQNAENAKGKQKADEYEEEDFAPTNDSLILHLKRKVSDPFYAMAAVEEVRDFYNHTPSTLYNQHPITHGEGRYFFVYKDRDEVSPYREAKGGYWEPTGYDVRIIKDDVSGFMKRLMYYRGSYPSGTMTSWTMREYLLDKGNSSEKPGETSKTWVICKLSRFPLGDETEEEEEEGGASTGYDGDEEDGPGVQVDWEWDF